MILPVFEGVTVVKTALNECVAPIHVYNGQVCYIANCELNFVTKFIEWSSHH